MITSSDSFSCIDLEDYYCILPAGGNLINKYIEQGIRFRNVSEGFVYSSNNNEKFLTIEEIRDLIKNNIDENFKPN